MASAEGVNRIYGYNCRILKGFFAVKERFSEDYLEKT